MLRRGAQTVLTFCTVNFCDAQRNRMGVLMPFHAAEQHNKKQKNNSAERRDFPRCLLFVSAQGSQPQAVQVIGCLFFGSFLWANKEMNYKNIAFKNPLLD